MAHEKHNDQLVAEIERLLREAREKKENIIAAAKVKNGEVVSRVFQSTPSEPLQSHDEQSESPQS